MLAVNDDVRLTATRDKVYFLNGNNRRIVTSFVIITRLRRKLSGLRIKSY